MTRNPRRVLATILFTDIVRSTEVAAEMGDRRWRTVLSSHHRLVRVALKRNHGQEIDNAGDGFFASFSQPTDAIRCAAEIVAATKALGIEVRAGIHTGEGEIIGKKVGGIAVHIASRVLAEAGPSEVLVTSTVADLAAGSDVRFDDLGVRALKGVPGEWRLSRLDPASVLPDQADDDAETPAARRVGPRAVGVLVVGAVAVTAVVAAAIVVLRPPDQPAATPGPDTTIRIDATGRATAVVNVPAGPDSIVYDGSSVWVGSVDAGLVTRFAPDAHGDVDTLGQLGRPTALAGAEAGVWVADRFVRQVRSVDRTGVARFTVEDLLAASLAIGFGAAWASDDQVDRLRRLDLDTGQIETEVELPSGSSPAGLAIGGGRVWVALPGIASVAAVDPAAGTAAESPVELPSAATALSAAGELLWAVAPADDEVHLVDTGRSVRLRSVPVCDQPSAAAADEAGAWIACREGRAVWRVLNDGTIESRFPMAAVPSALVLADGELWITLRAD